VLNASSQPPSSGPTKRPRLAEACIRPRTRPCQRLFTNEFNRSQRHGSKHLWKLGA
jgi:hypothetical protein